MAETNSLILNQCRYFLQVPFTASLPWSDYSLDDCADGFTHVTPTRHFRCARHGTKASRKGTPLFFITPLGMEIVLAHFTDAEIADGELASRTQKA